ncbi:uncharacterized protein AB9W97_011194 [Spinachia spinachia]
MGLVAALVALHCLWAHRASGAEGCGGFQHLENGQTFFRYGGLLVIFRCRPGYKLHGYKTNSCVSEHWSRDTPVCVGSGCSNPGPLGHGTSSTNEDGSWVAFSCNAGFQLRGPSMLYCKGPTWNSTKPVCQESDMMRSASRVNVQPPNARQNLQAAAAQRQSRYDAPTDSPASKEENLRFVLFSHTPSQMSDRERIKVTNQKVHLREGVQFSQFSHFSQVKDGLQTNHVGASSNFLSSAKEQSPSSPLSLSAAQTPASTAVPDTQALAPTSPVHRTGAAPALPGRDVKLHYGEPVTSEAEVLPSEAATGSSHTDQPDGADFLYPPQAGPDPYTLSTSVYFTSTSSSSTQSIEKTHVTTEAGSHQGTSYSAALDPPPPSARPVCVHPPVPAHGTFYFHHGTRELRQYVQYVCSPGYTLADGNTHSYCQRGDTWSGITPVCLELAPCSVNHGGCSQLCSLPEHHNQSTSRTQAPSRCHCRAGFTLRNDGRTCQDIDECAENQGLGPCAERCLNSPGSYQCSCSYGYVLAGNGHSCIAECPPGYRKQPAATTPAPALREECVDINECLEETCEGQCVNLPGSHRCICPRGYALQRDGRRCKDINECSRRNGGCSHLCLNQKGGYKCACPGSHQLSPYSWKKCLPRTTAASAG